VLLDGARVVIVGPPNAGKSTLANRLFERPWSIESDQPGTTRDWVHQTTAVRGLPIMLADTAGLRDSGDPLEVEAINKAHPIIRDADVQILVLDARHPESRTFDGRMVNFLQPDRLIVVLNKRDLIPKSDARLNTSNLGAPRTVLVSALMNEGIENLRDAILRTLDLEPEILPAPAIWDPRQLDAITAARSMARQDVAGAAARLQREFCPLRSRNGGSAGL
jgi:tRNA modification GTPase